MNEKEQERLDNLIERATEYWFKYVEFKKGSDVEMLRNYVVRSGAVSKEENSIIHKFYKENGLWEDGITTLEQRRKDLLMKKQEFGRRIAELKNKRISSIDSIITNMEDQKKKIEQIPVKLKKDYRAEQERLLTQNNELLDKIYESICNEIDNEITKIYSFKIGELEKERDRNINYSRKQLEGLKTQYQKEMETQIKNYGAEMEAELLVIESKEHDEQQLRNYEKDIAKINQELNELDVINEDSFEEKEVVINEPSKTITPIEDDNSISYENFTVAQLREMAIGRGLELPNGYITKPDLIEKLENIK